MRFEREHTPGAKAPLFLGAMRPKAKALGYLIVPTINSPFLLRCATATEYGDPSLRSG
jgi:hypothetical protein